MFIELTSVEMNDVNGGNKFTDFVKEVYSAAKEVKVLNPVATGIQLGNTISNIIQCGSPTMCKCQ